MNRLAVLAFLLALSRAAAFAQTETVTVTDESLVGPWRIGMPLWGFVQRNGGTNNGPMRDAYCRVGGKRDDLHVYCLKPRTPFTLEEGNMRLRSDSIHICWCDFFGSDTIDATQKTPGIFSGSLVTTIIGFPVSRVQGVSIASKIAVSATTPDVGGKSAVLGKLLAAIADGAPLSSLLQLRERHPDGRPPVIAARELRALGPIQLVAYLGHTATPEEYTVAGGAIMPNDDRTALMQVYDVEFANGERVCEISTREDGLVNGLVCI